MRGSLGLGIDINLIGGRGGDGIVITSIFNDSNIVITFSEAVQPATVTNIGDGTGSFELYNDTDAAWVAGVLSTSDNIQWTFNPTVNFTVGDSLTLYLKDTILTVVGSNPYTGPFEFKYTVVASPPIAPTLDSVVAGDTKNTITFTDNDTSDSFNIHWGTVAGVLPNTITGVTSPYDHTGLTNGTEYFYEVVAIKGGLESDPSSEGSATPIVSPLIAEWTFQDSTGNDSAGSNDLTLTDTQFVDISGDIALDTQTAGFALNSAIDSVLDDLTVGTFDMVISRTDVAQTDSQVISFSTAPGVLEEIQITTRGTDSSNDNSVNIAVLDAGAIKISWFTANSSIPTNSAYFRLTVTADGSGTNANGYRVYVDGVEKSITSKVADVSGYRGILPGDSLLSTINSVKLGGVNRAAPYTTAEIIYKYMRIYNEVLTPTEIDAL